ncbi:hypothetical protein [Candidatus Amarobacter glycogenicus]|uniref:hypothetical protein n=1 Tax=Candidatus Amarobacter glycogenicus TaxID=3140699 RepID=UPI00313602BF|nr:hypothetical protein [Dehalococcoidia bacterium]MCC6266514.1 hypothetical protein [Dehalococcoidia bacterium]
MSVPGGPPKLPADNSNVGGVAFVTWTSSNIPNTDYFQKTLAQLETKLADQQARWETILMLRALRFRLGTWNSLTFGAEMMKLANSGVSKKMMDVWLDARLSVVGARAGVTRISSNRAHLDVDWFDFPLPHWWMLPPSVNFSGAAAEKHVAERLLWFLEDSVSLGPSPVNPANWTWPPGTTGGDWPDKAKLASAPPFKAGFQTIKLEWHMGRNLNGITCASLANVFWLETPKVSRQDI